MAGPGGRKAAFVTGGASGIGRATAAGFLARGYAVALADRDATVGRRTEAELRGAGDCVFVSCDVADDDSVRRAVEQAVATYGRIDAAFNAAGIGGEIGQPTAASSVENWHRVLAVDLTGVWFCMRHQIAQMLRTGGGAIVNCSSMAGLLGAEGMSAYTAAKHGVVGLTRTAALEYARHGIRVNAVCPGMVDTPMSKDVGPEFAAAMNAATPVGRFARPEEIASAVLWLCDESASYVTGQAIAVDGGLGVR